MTGMQITDSEVDALRLVATCLSRAQALNDEPSCIHENRVAAVSGAVALELGLSANAVEATAYAAVLHDIGKIAVPREILDKPGPLTVAEREVVATHTVAGHDILGGQTASPLEVALQVALHHHERYDGKGYPHGIAGEDIPLVPRIVAICDVYDALRDQRSYRHGLDHDEAMAAIEGNLDAVFIGAFDSRILKAFRRVIEAHLDICYRPEHLVGRTPYSYFSDIRLRHLAA